MTFAFQDWVLTRQEEQPDRQYDHLSGSLTVTGVPEGYRWDMLVQVGGHFDKWPLSQVEGGVGIPLTKDMLSVDGRYSMQLVGTLQEDGTTTRHTNVLQVYVPCSLSGDAHWPTLPMEFTQAEERMREAQNEAAQFAKNAGKSAEAATLAAQAAEASVQGGKYIFFDIGPDGHLYLDKSEDAEIDFHLEEGRLIATL